MRPDPADIRKTRRVAAEAYTRDCPRGIGSVLHTSWSHARRVIEISATIRGRRVNMYDGIAAVKFFHDRPERRSAEPRIVIAREESDTIGLQRVIGICDLLQRRIDVGQRHRREKSKSPWIVLHELCGIFVARTGEAAGHGLVAKPQPRIRDRDHRCRDASAVHVFDGFRRSPRGIRGLKQGPPFDVGNPNRRTGMMMDVDAKRLSRSTPLRQSEGAKELDETSSIRIAHQITHLIAKICTAIYTTELCI